jgi:MoaD family protein
MKIAIHSILGLRKALGQNHTEIDLPSESTVADVFSYMKERWGEMLAPHLFDAESGKVHSHLRIMVNGQEIHFLQGMGTQLNEGDEVLILPLISGG